MVDYLGLPHAMAATAGRVCTVALMNNLSVLCAGFYLDADLTGDFDLIGTALVPIGPIGPIGISIGTGLKLFSGG